MLATMAWPVRRTDSLKANLLPAKLSLPSSTCFILITGFGTMKISATFTLLAAITPAVVGQVQITGSLGQVRTLLLITPNSLI